MMQHKKTESASSSCFIGIDLGGTSTTIGFLDANGNSLAKKQISTLGKKGPDAALTRISETIEEMLNYHGIPRSSVKRVGLATPGTMDIAAGILIAPSNLPSWQNYPIRDSLQAKSGFSITFTHDAAAAAYGEYWQGAGKNESGLVIMTLGTGIGCGIILNGQVWNGVHCHAGECGHVLIDISNNARWCNCGQQGHLEAYASATGLIKRTLEFSMAGLNTSLSQRVHSLDQKAEIPKILYEEALAGDAFAQKLIDETAFYISSGLISLVHTVDPSCILIGGAMTFGGSETKVGERFIEHIREGFRSRTFRYLAERIRIDYAQLGSDAGYIGAAGLAMQDANREEKVD
jgi:glucokinase